MSQTTTPEGWRTVRLDTVADFLSGGTPSKARPQWWTGTIPWASPKDMKRFRLTDTIDHITEEAAKAGSRVVPAKTIFVVIRGMILVKALPVAMAEVPMAFNQDMKAIVPRPGADPDFLLYALASRRDALAREIGTSAHGTRRLGSSSLEALEIFAPPRHEQLAIGYLLSTLQRSVDIRSESVAHMRRVSVATTAGIFREGLHGEPLKTTDFGVMPASWSVVPLGELCRGQGALIQTGPFGGQLHASDYRSTGIPVVNPTHIHGSVVDTQLLPRISPVTVERLAKHKLHAGDVLFSRRGDVGRHAYISELQNGWLCGTGCLIVRSSPVRIHRPYLACALKSTLAQTYLRSAAVGSIMPNINTRILAGVPILLPSRDEQIEIARIFDALDRGLRLAVEAQARAVELFETMLKVLTTGRVRLPPRLIAKLSLRTTPTVPKPQGKADEGIVQDAVRRIVEAVAPEKVVLFGSAARGEMGPDSDLDFLVVKRGMNRWEALRAISRALYRDRRGVGRPVDVVVVTPEDIERDRDTIGLIIRPALREGRVVYAA